jgi:type II secretory pathway pseudopilin PulG
MRLRATEAHPGRSGAALLMAVLILIVLAAIVFQIFVATSGAARIARNDLAMSAQELAIESALLEEYDKIKTDGEAADSGSAAGAGGAGANPAGGAAGGAGGGAGAAGGAGQSQACDSQRDEWYQPARTEINEVRLRVFAQDEDSKVNVLSMLVRDEKAAKEAFERVVRVLDKCRDGTTADIDSRTAEDMAKAMLEYMTKGKKSEIPRANQISDDPANQDLKLPRSLREFQILKPFEPSHFRDFRDDHDRQVHSIESFLTVWSALETAGDKPPPPNASGTAPKPGTGSTVNPSNGGTATSPGSTKGGTGSQTPTTDAGGAPVGAFGGGSTPGSSSSGNGAGQTAGGSGASGGSGSGSSGSGSGVDTGGWQINVNTAPPAVLKSLFDDREVNPRFWDKVIEYRNLEEEKDKNKDTSAEPEAPAEPVFDEYGREVIQRRIFENLQELEEVEGWKDFPAEVQTRIKSMLTVQSRVFSVFVVARRATAIDDASALGADPQALRIAEEKGDSLMRVVRSVVWRHKVDDEMKITPLIRWELLDSTPHEVLDYPEDRR